MKSRQRAFTNDTAKGGATIAHAPPFKEPLRAFFGWKGLKPLPVAAVHRFPYPHWRGCCRLTQVDPPYIRIEYKFFPDYLNAKDLGEIDILASRQVDGQTEVLLCECKMREESVQVEWLTRLARKRQKVVEKLKPNEPERVKAWLVTIVETIEDAEKASQLGIEIYQARLPSNWRDRADWEVEGLTPLRTS